MTTEERFSDAQAVELLSLIRDYLEAYPEETPTTMTVYALAGDLMESLPADQLAVAGLTDEVLSATGLA